jgi:3',5'-nucleoside bisphosphate phosphatase
MRVELHCHSTASDGSDSPGVVGRRASDQGLALFSLTDHDTCSGWTAAAAELDASVTTPLAGVEVSAVEAGRTVHLLVYDAGRDGRWSQLATALGEQARARRVRMRDMVARLVQRGVAITWEDVMDEVRLSRGQNATDDGVLGRPHLARALVRRGAVSSVSEAFARYLGDGGVADVPLSRLSVAQALELAVSVGARVSLAHPHTIGPVMASDLMRRYRERGLDGLEAAYGAYGARERSDWMAMAASFGAVVTGGSDYHGFEGESGPGVEIPDALSGRLMEWLAVG